MVLSGWDMSHGCVDGKTQNVTCNYSCLEAFKNATTLDCWDAINQLLLLHGAQTSQGAAAATQEGFFVLFFLQNKRKHGWPWGDGQAARVSALSADSWKSRLADRSAASGVRGPESDCKRLRWTQSCVNASANQDVN